MLDVRKCNLGFYVDAFSLLQDTAGSKYTTQHKQRDLIHYGLRYALESWTCTATWIQISTTKFKNNNNFYFVHIIFNYV